MCRMYLKEVEQVERRLSRSCLGVRPSSVPFNLKKKNAHLANPSQKNNTNRASLAWGFCSVAFHSLRFRLIHRRLSWSCVSGCRGQILGQVFCVNNSFFFGCFNLLCPPSRAGGSLGWTGAKVGQLWGSRTLQIVLRALVNGEGESEADCVAAGILFDLYRYSCSAHLLSAIPRRQIHL
jgi:hypothetical protein